MPLQCHGPALWRGRRAAWRGSDVCQGGAVIETRDDIADLMSVAARLATETGELIREGRAHARVAGTKSATADIVTQMDLAAESHLASRLAQWRPRDGLLGEEGAAVASTSGITWIVDPIDGTVNYLYGLPHYAVSVAAVRGEPVPGRWTALAGAVHDGSGTLWTAGRGHGAWRDGERLVRAGGPALEGTLLATGFQYIAARRQAQGRIVAQLLPRVRDIRRLGAASVDLCLVAAGELDAYYEHGLNPWDFAAGALICQEAGVRVGSVDGGEPTSQLLIAAMESSWEDLRDAIVEAGGTQPWDTPSG